MSITQPSVPTGSVSSADGTTIGYRRVGHGPGVVLVHGGVTLPRAGHTAAGNGGKPDLVAAELRAFFS